MVSIRDLPKEILVNILDNEPKIEIENLEQGMMGNNFNSNKIYFIKFNMVIKYINIEIKNTQKIPINDPLFIENLEKFLKDLSSGNACKILSPDMTTSQYDISPYLNIIYNPDKYILIDLTIKLSPIFRVPLIKFVKKLSLMVSGQNIDSEIKLIYNKLKLIRDSDIVLEYTPDFFPLKIYPYKLLEEHEIDKFFKILNKKTHDNPLIYPLLHIDYKYFLCWYDYGPNSYLNVDIDTCNGFNLF